MKSLRDSILSERKYHKTRVSCTYSVTNDVPATSVGQGFDPPRYLVPGDVVRIAIAGLARWKTR